MKNATIAFRYFLACSICLFAGFAQAQDANSARPNISGPEGVLVNSYSGNLFVPRQDLFVPGRGLDIDLEFSYNSGLRQMNDGYGPGWTMTYNMSYQVDSAGNITVLGSDGRTDTYPLLNGQLLSPSGVFDTLIRLDGTRLKLATKSGTEYLFEDDSHKKLTKIIDRNGNTLALAYAGGQLSQLTDPSGRTVSFSWSQGRLQQLVLNTNPTRTVQYQYDAAGNPVRVVNPAGGAREYRYDEESKMTALIDEDGNAVAFSYNTLTAVTKIISCVGTINIAYDYQGLKTLVTERVGGDLQLTTYEYDAQGRLGKQRGNCCGYNEEFQYDKDLNISKLTDANGNINLYTYDNKGNLTQEVNAMGDFQTYTYNNPFSLLTGKTDFNGNSTTYDYDAKGNLTAIHYPLSIQETYGYDAFGNAVSHTDGNGNSEMMTYDANGYLMQKTDANGGQTLYSYDPFGNKTSETDPNGNTSAYEYDALNRLVKMTDPLGHFETYTYDGRGNKTSETDKLGHTTTYQYDGLSRQTAKIDALGNRTGYEYDEKGNMTRYVDALGNSTKLQYNRLNKVAQITNALGEKSGMEYDGNGNLITLALPNNNSFNIQYDALDRPVSVTDEIGGFVQILYDKNGNALAYLDGNGTTVQTYRYDALNRVTQIENPSEGVQSLQYDKNGNNIQVTDKLGNVYGYIYDNLNRVITENSPAGDLTAYEYDPVGNMIRFIDPNNHITAFIYDALNRLSTSTLADGSSLSYTYDALGNVTRRKDNIGNNTQYVYDPLSRLVSRTYQNGQTDQFTFDAVGNFLSAVNAYANLQFSYDKLNRMVTETLNGKSTTLSYLTSARQKKLKYPGGREITEQLDGRGRLTAISDAAMQTPEMVQLMYHLNNTLSRKIYSNGTVSDYSYSSTGRRLQAIQHQVNGQAIQYQYDYDQGDNRIAERLPQTPDRSRQFAYNARQQLTQEKIGTFIGNDIINPLKNSQFNLDALGNRVGLQENNNTLNYTVNNLNQYTNIQGAINQMLEYDANGNLSSDGAYTFEYDQENKLTKASGANTAEFRYDAFGRCIQKIANGDTLSFYYHQLRLIEVQKGGSTLASFVYGVGLNGLVSMQRGANHYFYLEDGLGSVVGLTDEAGDLVESYAYDAYGNPSFFDAAQQPMAASQVQNPFLFTGHWYDAEIGLYNFRARFYSPRLGRFLQRDPKGYVDGLSLYEYVRNNPMVYVDHLGEELSLALAGGGALSLGVNGTAAVGLAATVGGVIAIGLIAVGTALVIKELLKNNSGGEPPNDKDPKKQKKAPPKPNEPPNEPCPNNSGKGQPKLDPNEAFKGVKFGPRDTPLKGNPPVKLPEQTPTPKPGSRLDIKA